MNVAIEVAHWSAFVPLLYLGLLRGRAPTAFVVVALAFACSAVGDSVAAMTGGSWVAEPYYLTAQYALFALAFLADGSRHVLVPVVIYAGLGTALYLLMVRELPEIAGQPTDAEYEAFMRWWWPYQGVRLAAFGAFCVAAWRHAQGVT